MRPPHVLMHGVVPWCHLLGRDPLVQIKAIPHAPPRHGTKSGRYISLQSPINGAAPAALETPAGLATLMIAPQPEVHHAPGCMYARDEQFHCLKSARVRLGHGLCDTIGLGGHVKPPPANHGHVEPCKSVFAHECPDLRIDQCGLLIIHGGPVVRHNIVPHDQLRDKDFICALPRPFVPSRLQEAVGIGPRIGQNRQGACLTVQVRVGTRGRKCPQPCARACKAEPPARASRVEHLCHTF